MSNPTPIKTEKRRWKLTTSQRELLLQQAKVQQEQLRPFQELQGMARRLLLETFRTELGIPSDAILDFDANTFTLKEK